MTKPIHSIESIIAGYRTQVGNLVDLSYQAQSKEELPPIDFAEEAEKLESSQATLLANSKSFLAEHKKKSSLENFVITALNEKVAPHLTSDDEEVTLQDLVFELSEGVQTLKSNADAEETPSLRLLNGMKGQILELADKTAQLQSVIRKEILDSSRLENSDDPKILKIRYELAKLNQNLRKLSDYWNKSHASIEAKMEQLMQATSPTEVPAKATPKGRKPR